MKESAVQLIQISKADKEFTKALAYARYCAEKRARFLIYLYMRMMGKW